MLTTGPRGTKDILPDSSVYWQYIEQTARRVCRLYGYQEIRTPVFEHTELFLRGIGETTDIVEKEMYTFQDRGERSLTLRPENTASVVRSYLENKLYSQPQPTKLYYIGPMFRYDRPQAGRYRQFHQFGVEGIGCADASIDAEIIELAVQYLEQLGLKDLQLYINSVGCPKCRPVYRQKLQSFLSEKKQQLCHDCQSRYDRNPMRILDCKNEKCNEASQGAPQMAECLCEECSSHFTALQEYLAAAGTNFILNPRLVRGLDYYTKTAFEIQYPPLGAQSAVCGGGRYDGLIEECGGDSTPGIGFAMGMERILLALEKQNLFPTITGEIDVFFAPLGAAAKNHVFRMISEMRKAGFSCEMDHLDRSLKAQMKHANRYPAKFVVILGEDEVAVKQLTLRNMQNGEQETIAWDLLEKKITALMEE